MSIQPDRTSEVVVIAPESSKRVELFQQALYRLGMPQARHVSYLDLMSGRTSLSDLAHGSIVRIESPGKCFAVERTLLQWGAPDAESEGSAFVPHEICKALEFDRGLILYPRQWYLGYCRVLDLLSSQLAACAPAFMNHPSDIRFMFDKAECQRLLQGLGVRTPKPLGSVKSFEELRERMRERGIFRVFIKLSHGSSASGAVAYQTDRSGRRHSAVSTVEMVRNSGLLHLYNSRRIRKYERESEIAELVDSLSSHHLHVEAWLPKATQRSQSFDLRVVVVGGRAAHTVVRLSRTPFTNLHLLNERGDLGQVMNSLGAHRWQSAMNLCQDAMKVFPDSLYGGVDLLIQPDLQSHAILEVNAFGDLLPNILFEDVDTYEFELRSALGRS
jgi:hypothetical protein